MAPEVGVGLELCQSNTTTFLFKKEKKSLDFTQNMVLLYFTGRLTNGTDDLSVSILEQTPEVLVYFFDFLNHELEAREKEQECIGDKKWRDGRKKDIMNGCIRT